MGFSASDSSRATAVADFYALELQQFLGNSTDVQTQLRECMVEDQALYHLYEETVQALIEEDDERWDAYYSATKSVLDYTLQPCMEDVVIYEDEASETVKTSDYTTEE